MKYDDFFEDEVMREVMEWKAQIAEEFPTWEAYHAHLREQRPRLEAEGWKFASPADLPNQTIEKEEPATVTL